MQSFFSEPNIFEECYLIQFVLFLFINFNFFFLLVLDNEFIRNSLHYIEINDKRYSTINNYITNITTKITVHWAK